MNKKLFKPLNEQVEVVKIEDEPITEEERKSVEQKVLFEDHTKKVADKVNFDR